MLLKYISEIHAITIDEDLDAYDDLSKFKNELLNSCAVRFTGKHPEASKVSSRKLRSIVTMDLFRHLSYVLATFLDPRMRLLPFEGTFIKLMNLSILIVLLCQYIFIFCI